MTAKTQSPPRSNAKTGRSRKDSLAGTGKLLSFMLRRDRIWFPAWVLGLSLMMVYFSNALGNLLDDETVGSFAALAMNPVMALIGGPGYGFEQITIGKIIVGLYGVYLMLGAALMSIMTVSRHTRVEEQTGRAELVRANVVGRHAQLAAALALVALMNLLMTALMTFAFYFSSIEPHPFAVSLLFASSIGTVGLVFGGVAAVTVQLSAFSRAASGIAGAVLAVSFAVRGLGDMSFVQGGNLDWLSWLSPLGWSQQTAPLTLDRWWPLGISLVATMLLVATSFALQSRRDLAAGILPDRLGPAVAPSWLRTSLSLSYRLQRSALSWWSVAMLTGGITFGAFVQPMAENAAGMPPELTAILGGAEGMVDGYLGFMGVFFAIMVAVFAVLSVQALRGEEQSMRTEPVLATNVSRGDWIISWTVVTALGSLWLLVLSGVGDGAGAAFSTGNWTLLGKAILGQVAHAPAIWVLLGLAVALYGFAPRMLGLTWVVFTWGAALSMFGEMMQLSETVLGTSVFRHVGQYPAETISWTAVALLSGVGLVLTTAGTAGFPRRDLITA